MYRRYGNGKVFSCQALEKHPKNYMGNLTDDFINSENWNYWRKRNKFLNENCLNCEVIGSCGGGCAIRWLSSDPSEAINDKYIYTREVRK